MLALTHSFAAPATDHTTIPIPRFFRVDVGVYRGARPLEAGVRYLAQVGVKTIVNLEHELSEEEPGEVRKERAWAATHGMSFVHIPMHPWFRPTREQVERVLAILTDSAAQPVFVHCYQGVDRTGLVIAAYRMRVQGWSQEAAVQELYAHGFHRILDWLFEWTAVLRRSQTERSHRPGLWSGRKPEDLTSRLSYAQLELTRG